jgi:hypothetical protein
MKPEKFPNKRLTFKCDQDIDRMPTTKEGKYCQLCKKTVIDFTDKTYQQFLDITKDKIHYCGIYYEEQIEDIYPINLNFRKPKLIATFLTAILGLSSSTILAQDKIKPKTEQSPIDTSDQENIVINDTSDNTSEKKCSALEKARKHKIIETQGRIIYFSKKFPFIKSRKKRIRLAGF